MRKHSIDFVATLDSNFQAALTSAVALRVGAKRDGCVLIWLGTDVLIDSRQKPSMRQPLDEKRKQNMRWCAEGLRRPPRTMSGIRSSST
jgi:hypothetical protein